jgi:hypothetical protein
MASTMTASTEFIKDPCKRRGTRRRAVVAPAAATAATATAAKAAAGPTYEELRQRLVKWFNEDRLVEAGA